MKVILIFVGVVILLVVLIRAFVYHNAIRHGRCPICGAPIVPFANGYADGYHCTECDWNEIRNEYDSKF